MRPFMLAASTILLASHGAAQTVVTPAAGTPMRKAILDAMRPRTISEFDTRYITFKVVSMRVGGQWAFVQAVALNAALEPLYAESGAKEIWALLQKSGQTWQLRRWAMPTDVISEEWEQAFPNVPKPLWPHYRW